MINKLIAQNKPILPIKNEEKELYIIISSLNLGGAEKIVKDWAMTEANRDKKITIAILHNHKKEHYIKHKNITVIRRNERELMSDYLDRIVPIFSNKIVSTHLLNNSVYEYLWKKNIKTVPVVHNDKQGWKNEATFFNNDNVIQVVACAEYVKKQLIENGLTKKIVIVRHLPIIPVKSCSQEKRKEMRTKYDLDSETVAVGVIGSLKQQKNHIYLIDLAKKMNKNIVFFIFGDVINNKSRELKKNLINEIEKNELFNSFKFMGFQNDIFEYFPMLDAVLNCSTYEGYSIATQEALLANIPVISSNVSGQSEIKLAGLKLIDDFNVDNYVDELNKIAVRKNIKLVETENTSRLWTLTVSERIKKSKKKFIFSNLIKKQKVLFLTANLNAGGAQRSLINLTKTLGSNVEIAVCNTSTNDYFTKSLQKNKINVYQLTTSRDVYDITSSLLKEISEKEINTICLWNVDPKIKLLLSNFICDDISLVDVSPGGYAFEELNQTERFQTSTTITKDYYYNRLNKLILKFNADTHEVDKYHNLEKIVINNGVEDFAKEKVLKNSKKILVSGRIVQSKHSLEIIKAFKQFNKQNNQEYSLVFYGQAEERNKEYLESVYELAKDENIEFKGADPTLSFLKENYFCTIILGTHQGCPNAALEAASGLVPIIANDSGGTREIVNDKTGILIQDEFNIQELVLALTKLKLANRNEMVFNAKKLVHNNFSMKKMKQRYKKLAF